MRFAPRANPDLRFSQICKERKVKGIGTFAGRLWLLRKMRTSNVLYLYPGLNVPDVFIYTALMRGLRVSLSRTLAIVTLLQAHNNTVDENVRSARRVKIQVAGANANTFLASSPSPCCKKRICKSCPICTSSGRFRSMPSMRATTQHFSSNSTTPEQYGFFRP